MARAVILINNDDFDLFDRLAAQFVLRLTALIRARDNGRRFSHAVGNRDSSPEALAVQSLALFGGARAADIGMTKRHQIVGGDQRRCQ